jgi:hypothetical protein
MGQEPAGLNCELMITTSLAFARENFKKLLGVEGGNI